MAVASKESRRRKLKLLVQYASFSFIDGNYKLGRKHLTTGPTAAAKNQKPWMIDW